MSRHIIDIERTIAQAAIWAEQWQMLELEALDVADGMGDPEAKRHMLFVADSYGLLAEHAELQIAQLLALAADKDPDDDHQII